MRFSFVVASVVAAAVASAEEQPSVACPAPVACDYSEWERKVATLSTQNADCLHAKLSELEAKEQLIQSKSTSYESEIAKLKADSEQNRKAAVEWQARSTKYEQQVASLEALASKAKQADEVGAQLSALEAKHQAALAKSREDLSTWQKAFEELKTKSTSDISQCEAGKEALKKEHDTYIASMANYESKHRQLQQEVKDSQSEINKYKASAEEHRRRLSELDAQLQPLTQAMFSRAHLGYTWKHLMTVTKAFGNYLVLVVQRFAGPDAVELVQLQIKIWSGNAIQKSREVITPLQIKAIQFYNEKLRDHCATPLEYGLEMKDRLVVLGKDLGAKAIVYSERFLNRFVNNLSKVDPSIQQVFGEEFIDRALVAGYLSLWVMLAHALINWVFSTFIVSPFCWTFGINTSKPSSKRSSSSRKRGSKSRRAAHTLVHETGVPQGLSAEDKEKEEEETVEGEEDEDGEPASHSEPIDGDGDYKDTKKKQQDSKRAKPGVVGGSKSNKGTTNSKLAAVKGTSVVTTNKKVKA